MPTLNWQHSAQGGWYAVDAEGNRWHMPANKETVSVTTPDGRRAIGWTEALAWQALDDPA